MGQGCSAPLHVDLLLRQLQSWLHLHFQFPDRMAELRLHRPQLLHMFLFWQWSPVLLWQDHAFLPAEPEQFHPSLQRSLDSLQILIHSSHPHVQVCLHHGQPMADIHHHPIQFPQTFLSTQMLWFQLSKHPA